MIFVTWIYGQGWARQQHEQGGEGEQEPGEKRQHIELCKRWQHHQEKH